MNIPVLSLCSVLLWSLSHDNFHASHATALWPTCIGSQIRFLPMESTSSYCFRWLGSVSPSKPQCFFSSSSSSFSYHHRASTSFFHSTSFHPTNFAEDPSFAALYKRLRAANCWPSHTSTFENETARNPFNIASKNRPAESFTLTPRSYIALHAFLSLCSRGVDLGANSN